MTKKDLFKVALTVVLVESICRWPVKTISDKHPIKMRPRKHLRDNRRKYHAKFEGGTPVFIERPGQ